MKPFPFAIWLLQKAPTESGLSPEEHARLTARFPSTTPPTPPSRLSNEGEWEDAHNANFHAPGSSLYRQAGPRTGPDDEGLMRNVAVRTPTGEWPMVTIKDMDESVVPAVLGRSKHKNLESKYSAKQHIEHTGSVNNGDMFLRLGLLHKNIADQIANEYVKWHDGGGGPIPDLSKYENPVTRNEDGTPWDWRKTAAEAHDLHKHARDYDFYHQGIYDRLGDPLREVSEINPRKIWQQIHMLATKKWDPDSRSITPIQARAINLNTLRTEGLRAHQYPDIVKALMRLGHHHRRMHLITEKSFSRQYGSVRKANPFPFAIWPNRGNIK